MFPKVLQNFFLPNETFPKKISQKKLKPQIKQPFDKYGKITLGRRKLSVVHILKIFFFFSAIKNKN